MIQVIFCLLTSPKFDVGEVENSKFLVVARHWEHVFFFLNSQKCEMGEVEKAMFRGGA